MLVYPNTITIILRPAAYFQKLTDVSFVQNKPRLSQYLRVSKIEVTEEGQLILFFVLPDYVIVNGQVFAGRFNKDDKFVAVKIANVKLTQENPVYVHLFTEQSLIQVEGTEDLVQLSMHVHVVLSDSWLSPYEQYQGLQYYGAIRISYDKENRKFYSVPESFTEELYTPEYADRPYQLYVIVPDNPLYILTFGLTEDDIVVLPLVEGYDSFPDSEVSYLVSRMKTDWKSKEFNFTQLDLTKLQTPELVLDTPNFYDTMFVHGAYTVVEHIFVGAPVEERDIKSILQDEYFYIVASRKVEPDTYAF